MRIRIKRGTSSATAVNGILRCDGLPEIQTVERAVHDKPPCIPEGVYPVVLYFSPRLKAYTPLLLDVPGREWIEIHPANKASSLLGCIGPGMERKGEDVLRSREAWKLICGAIQAAVVRGEEVFLDIRS